MEINEKDRVTERVSAALSFLMTENMLHYISVLETRAIGAAVMSSYLGFVIGGYLLGSILFAYVLPKLTRHIDIREMSEDGNPGTYNAFWYGGVICGICVLLLELLKGFFPVWLCERTAGLQSLWFAAVMAAPVLGHAYSIYHRGRGGKAIAVSFGVLLGLVPAGIWQPLAMLVLFYLLFSLLFKIKSHARRSVVTYLCFAAGTCLTVEEQSVLVGSLLIAGTVIYRHTFGCPGEEKNERTDFIM